MVVDVETIKVNLSKTPMELDEDWENYDSNLASYLEKRKSVEIFKEFDPSEAIEQSVLDKVWENVLLSGQRVIPEKEK
ncbi:6929_t:CDS:2, partial [Gigaspora margarita]